MHYIAINQYRGATSNGFNNTWRIHRVVSRKVQLRLLNIGLPVNDQWDLHGDGTRSRSMSTMGIRIATRTEIRAAQESAIFLDSPPIN